jgi:hypothetical protein
VDLLDRTAGAARRRAIVHAVTAGVLLVGPAWWFFGPLPWNRLFLPLPIVLAGLIAVAIGTIRRHGIMPQAVARLAWCTFALLLLAKMILQPVIWQYGFVLAMPGVLALVAWLSGWLPRVLHGRGAGGFVMRSAAVVMVAIVLIVHLRVYAGLYADKPVRVGAGADAFFAASPERLPRGTAAARALGEMERIVPPGATLAAIPEGAMFNYLARRRNPTPFINLLPPEFIMFGADRIAAAYRDNPPDFLLIVPSNLSQYGSRGFDADYGRDIAAWIRANYENVGVSMEPGYRIFLLRRRG